MRLIDAEDYPYKNGAFDWQHGNKHFIRGIETMQEWIEDQTTVDAAPVVHARWVPQKESLGTYAKCSKCECRCKGYVPNYKYCPNCGARMDRKEPTDV